MKTVLRPHVYLAIAALVVTVAAAAPAGAQKQVPFKGTFQGQDTDTGSTPSTVTVATTGTGIATHLGQFSFSQEVTVNLSNGTDTGSARLIAANGDSVDVTIVGSGETTSTPGLFSITETWTIIGGTGRFAGAQGSVIVDRLASGITFLTSASFHGTITSPGATH
jgi:hypothetical protein